MNIPNQNLSPKEETLQLFNSIVSELDYSGCMNLQYALSSRIDILNKIPDKRKLLEPKIFIKWMCKRFNINTVESERVDFNIVNFWMCIINNLLEQKGLSYSEVAVLLNRSESLMRKYKIEYSRLYHIIHTGTDEANAFRADKKEFLIALREYNNIK